MKVISIQIVWSEVKALGFMPKSPQQACKIFIAMMRGLASMYGIRPLPHWKIKYLLKGYKRSTLKNQRYVVVGIELE